MSAKRIKPSEVQTHRTRRNPFEHIKTLRAIGRFREVPLPRTSSDIIAGQLVQYMSIVQPILATTIREFDTPNGALNARSSHRRASTVAQQLTPRELGELLCLRDDVFDHLVENYYSLARPPPLSGGDTARWSTATLLWLLTCLLSCVIRRFGQGHSEYLNYVPSAIPYLCAQLLVLDTAPISQFSMRALQLHTRTLLERLNTLVDFQPALTTYIAALQQRACELICGSGTFETGYNADEWCAPISVAHTSVAGVAAASINSLTCTTEFIAQSAIWFVVINQYVYNYYQIADPPAAGLVPTPSKERFSVEQTKRMRWFPTDAMRRRVLDFFCEYAAGCSDDTYRNGLRDYLMQFEYPPDQPAVYRAAQKVDVAIPADVLSYPVANSSPVARDFVRVVKYNTSLLSWLHRFWNWQYGETRIRSDYMGMSGFHTQLAILYIINLFMANKTRVSFRHRFVLYQSDPAFTYSCIKAKRSGFPFIVQQFGGWSVFIPHRADPRLGTFPADTTPEARAAANEGAEEQDGDVDDDGEYDSDYDFSDKSAPAPPAPARAPIASAGMASSEWESDMELARMADARGEVAAVDKSTALAGRIPDTLPVTEFCRTYDCETFFDAWIVWAIALLHINCGVIDRTDISHFLCRLFGWPHPSESE